jgi:capsule biosynthesis phosphatase
MILIIPLGGIGERFKKNNYHLPKALVNVFGKPILYYLLDNLNLSTIKIVCIPYNIEYANYRLEDRLRKDYPNIHFLFHKLEKNTSGAAETLNIALKVLSSNNIPNYPVLCLDGDNFYTTDIIHLWKGKNKIFVIEDEQENPIYSYVKLENNIVSDIVEKKKISNLACTGAYGFDSYYTLLSYTQKILDNNIRQNNEYYTSGAIKLMVEDNIKIETEIIGNKYWHCIGTPIQLKYFCNNYPLISCLDNKIKSEKLRICFDLDNTLVTFPVKKNDYSSVRPIEKNIQFLKYLKSFGHTIIIYTARRMKSHGGNMGKVMSDIGKITFDSLEKLDIPYDEIYFGKPQAHVYIDDLALNCFEDMEKHLGFYMDTVKPRDFNNISENNIQIITKTSDDLSGEIFYYNNIPSQIKDLFPIMIDYDDKNKWYKLEKINGVTCTSLYLSELLTENTLIHIMNSINRIHNCNLKDNDKDKDKEEAFEFNIYENYSSKLVSRYKSYDYSCFEDSESIFQHLLNELTFYQNEKLGKQTVIHGDTVMTNILINNFGKIKFIDMRGKLGKESTICGDWLYDWAKLYQSLIGYDKILQSKEISVEYEKKMIQTFEKYFIELFSEESLQWLKLITKSLLFTLIPLHHNEKCGKYFDLIKSIS